MYDVISSYATKNGITFNCIDDTHETKILAALADFAKSVFGAKAEGPSKPKPGKVQLSPFYPEYFTRSFPHSNARELFYKHFYLVGFSFLESFSPPPELG